MIAAISWAEAVATEPLKALLAGAALACVTIAAAWILQKINERSRSLRHQVLATALAAVAVGVLSSLALSWLMVLDRAELAVVLTVLAVTALTTTALIIVATSGLGRDVARLEAAVRRIEQGERELHTGVHRRDELGHVAHAIDELTTRLDQLERQRADVEAERSEMLTSISHDLRTPIAALQAAVEAMADGLAPDPDRYLAAMQRDIEALASLVDDLFLLVRLKHGRLDMPASSVDLTEIVDEAIEALTPVAVDRDITLRLDAPGAVRVKGNAAALGRVIRNLLDNALRHAPVCSSVVVSVDPDSRRVRVIDEGPGFPEAFAKAAFDRFTRADSSRNRDTGGAGLGLAIAQGLVKAHGGKIWIEQPPGGRVVFELPAA